MLHPKLYSCFRYQVLLMLFIFLLSSLLLSKFFSKNVKTENFGSEDLDHSSSLQAWMMSYQVYFFVILIWILWLLRSYFPYWVNWTNLKLIVLFSFFRILLSFSFTVFWLLIEPFPTISVSSSSNVVLGALPACIVHSSCCLHSSFDPYASCLNHK